MKTVASFGLNAFLQAVKFKIDPEKIKNKSAKLAIGVNTIKNTAFRMTGLRSAVSRNLPNFKYVTTFYNYIKNAPPVNGTHAKELDAFIRRQNGKKLCNFINMRV
jgi:hypothetical protein